MGDLLPRIGTANSPNNDFTAGLSQHFVEITPDGQTEEQLIKGLFRGYTSIGQGIDYRALANKNGQYNANSNNAAYTMAASAGIQNQFTNFAQSSMRQDRIVEYPRMHHLCHLVPRALLGQQVRSV